MVRLPCRLRVFHIYSLVFPRQIYGGVGIGVGVAAALSVLALSNVRASLYDQLSNWQAIGVCSHAC